MFGKHAVEVRLKKDSDTPAKDTKLIITTDDVTRIAKIVVTYVAMGTVATVAGVVAINTASEITVHKFTTPKWKDH